MKSLVHIFISALLALIFYTCTKKTEETPIDPASGCSNCTPSYATTYSGIFKAGTYTIAAPANTPTVMNRVSVFLSTIPIIVPSVANSTTVNSVLFNSDTLVYSAAPYYYTNIKPLNLSSITWSVNGAASIPSFTYKNLKNMPTIGSVSNLPDTVRRGIGFTAVLNNLKDFTSASIYVSDGLNTPNVFTKMLDLNSDTITFTPDNLMGIKTSTNGIITIFMENAHGIKVDSKDFKMSLETAYNKRVVIKN